ncbi:MAG: aromatic acid exporter family protein [Lachnospiraceae bacterium]|nr:aromatic acid exporter family protein [Lachnospiraceae bacterium]
MKRYPFKIGGRIVKTVIAVFLCFLVDTIRTSGAPFYAAIAAILCIQRNPKGSTDPIGVF